VLVGSIILKSGTVAYSSPRLLLCPRVAYGVIVTHYIQTIDRNTLCNTTKPLVRTFEIREEPLTPRAMELIEI
jgi:hypothetical protein